MNKIGIATAIICNMAFLSASAKTRKDVHYNVSVQNVIEIDSIDYRTDLTRVYGKLLGRPHTSNKIDNISGASDIDGVDFKRWYQFEEGGIIPIEIDFPATEGKFQFVVNTEHGIWYVAIN